MSSEVNFTAQTPEQTAQPASRKKIVVIALVAVAILCICCLVSIALYSALVAGTIAQLENNPPDLRTTTPTPIVTNTPPATVSVTATVTPTATPKVTSTPVVQGNKCTLPELGLTFTVPQGWNCTVDENDYSSNFEIDVDGEVNGFGSNGGFGPYYCDGPLEPGDSCESFVYLKEGGLDLDLYRYNGRDAEIFGLFKVGEKAIGFSILLEDTPGDRISSALDAKLKAMFRSMKFTD